MWIESDTVLLKITEVNRQCLCSSLEFCNKPLLRPYLDDDFIFNKGDDKDEEEEEKGIVVGYCRDTVDE